MRSELSPEILDAVGEESIYAHRKHKSNSIFDPGVSNEYKLAALVEEVGEVGRALTYDSAVRDDATHQHLIRELIQVANVALSWADCLSDAMDDEVNA